MSRLLHPLFAVYTCKTDGETWAEIGAKVGQRNLSVTADRYTHAMLDYGEIDRARLLGCVRVTHTPVHTRDTENVSYAGTF